MIDKSKLRSSMGHYKTQGLFLEKNSYDWDSALYTTADEDKLHPVTGETIYSLRRLYVAAEDVEEYDFAETYFAGWVHWQKIVKSPLLKKEIAEMREELAAKLRSRNIKRMETLATEGDKTAIRYMANRAWEKSTEPKRGRPSNEEKAGALKQELNADKAFEDHYERIMGGVQ